MLQGPQEDSGDDKEMPKAEGKDVDAEPGNLGEGKLGGRRN